MCKKRMVSRLIILTALYSSLVQANDEITVDLPGGATMDFVWIEPGTYMMGTTVEQQKLMQSAGILWVFSLEYGQALEPPASNQDGDEQPAHVVTLTHGFYLGKYEVTRQQWEAVLGVPPGQIPTGPLGQSPDIPASDITWSDTQVFIHALNHAIGDSLYRLPTEAEWEYAAHAGTSTLWPFGNDERLLKDYSWDVGPRPAFVDKVVLLPSETLSAGGGPYPVGLKAANPWGLHDMCGNVMEWVQDWYGPYSEEHQVNPLQEQRLPQDLWHWLRVARGGSFVH
jgi:formylglycine-generating enzyme required for sulfatase activity